MVQPQPAVPAHQPRVTPCCEDTQASLTAVSQPQVPLVSQSETARPTWLNAWRERVRAVADLPDGWDGHGSLSPSAEMVSLVEHWLSLALAGVADPQLPYLVPASSGGLQLEWHRSEEELEVLFTPDGYVGALYEDHRAGIEAEETGYAALDLFLRTAPRLASSRHDGNNVSVATTSPILEFAA